MIRILLTYLVIVWAARTAGGQVFEKDAPRKALKYYEKSVDAFRSMNYDKSEAYLLKSLEAEPDFVDALLRLADLCYRQKRYEEAARYFEKATALAPDYKYSVYQTLGRAYLHLEAYEKARQAYEHYLEKPGLSEKKRYAMSRQIENLIFSQEAKKHPVPFRPENLGKGVNSSDHEYLPTLTAGDSLMYFTRREGQLEDIWQSSRQDDQWEEAVNLGPPVNTPDFGEGSQAISPDGKTLYFAANWGDGEKIRGWDIYETEHSDSGWTTPRMLPKPVNTRSYESQPCISADGRMLFFSSRRKGGYGGKDLYVSYRKEDCSWGKPRNLGPVINTPGDEEVPFIHADGKTLYFGSNGHPGMGGSDLYYSKMDDTGGWSTPVNLGYPLNTRNNEGALFVSALSGYGYFASDQLEGEGGYDLYRFKLWDSIRPEPVAFILVEIFDRESGEKLDADFDLINLEKGESILNSNCNNYLKEYFYLPLPLETEFALNIRRPGYLFHSAHFSLTGDDMFRIRKVKVYLDKIKSGKRIILENVFFETDSFRLDERSFSELNELVDFLNQNPELKIEIGGHTDNTGDPAYNRRLSRLRAKSVRDYLLAHGIEAQRIRFEGYGDSRPVAGNDDAEGRSLNRRTEIRIE